MLEKISPAGVLEKVRENNQRIHSLQGRGKIIIDMPGAPFRGDVSIRVITPDSLFIFTEAVFGIDVGFLFADGTSFHSYSPIDNYYFTGPVDKIGRMVFFQMKISYRELMNSVLGAASFPLKAGTKVRTTGDKYIFTQNHQKAQLVYEVDAGKFVITKIQIVNREGEETFRQEFKRFRKVKGIWVPQYIRLIRPRSRESLTVFYNKIELNLPLSPQLFKYKIPANAHREQIG